MRFIPLAPAFNCRSSVKNDQTTEMTCIQVFIYSVTNWNTPHILDMRGATSLIVQAETHFLTLDTTQGVQVSLGPPAVTIGSNGKPNI